MNTLKTIAALAFLFAAGTVLAPRVKADNYNDLTKVTFSEPVEIPGQVLPAGTYWFRLLDDPAERNVVQIFNADQSKEIASLLALSDYRQKPSDKTIITFEERAANAPEAVKAWFYPGADSGLRFVYPKSRATQLARSTHEPVLSMPTEMEPNTRMPASANNASSLKKTSVKAQQPTGEEVDTTAVVQTPPQFQNSGR